MTAREILDSYERSWSGSPVIFGLPRGQLSPCEQAGELIKKHGLVAAREIATRKAREFPAAWNTWQVVADILATASE